MKITKAHQEHIAKTIGQFLAGMAKKRNQTPSAVVADHTAYVRREGSYQDLNKRIRWDVFSAAGLSPWVCDNVYSYADDTHIDTVLRRIMASI